MAWTISPDTISVNENTGFVDFTVSRSSTADPSQVFFSTILNGGSNTSDYTSIVDRSIILAAGSSTIVRVFITPDNEIEFNQTFGVIIQQTADPNTNLFLDRSFFTIANDDFPPVQQPDLTISNLSVTGPTSVAPGGITNVALSLSNIGAASATSYQAELFLSTNSTISTADQSLGAISGFNLAANGGSASTTFSFARPTTPGTYWIGAIADPNGQVSESNEGNNISAAIPITVTAAALPNVTIVAGSTVNEGSALSFTVTRSGGDFSQPLALNYSLNGTALIGLDYTAPTGTAIIAAGSDTAQINIATRNDGLDESPDDETVIITLQQSSQVNLVTGSATGTIHDVNSVTLPPTAYQAVISGSSWAGDGSAGRPTFVTYSFDVGAASYLTSLGYTQAFISSFQSLSAPEKELARVALAQWDAASGIRFLEVSPGLGDIRFGEYDFSLQPENATDAGFAYRPAVEVSSGFKLDRGGDIFLDRDWASEGFTTLHEIGHAIGLEHPFQDSGSSPPHLPANLDDQANTVMSYTGARPFSLGPLDIQAAQHLYGSVDGGHLVSWSWDASSLTLSQTGGGGGDTILGTSVFDVVNGGGGNDWLVGFGGADVLTGGRGLDFLTGGGDRDLFNYDSIKESVRGAARDVIVDFRRFVDDIDLSTIDANGARAGHTFKFIGTQGFHHRAGELHFKDRGINVIVEGDTNGDGRADFSILVLNVGALGRGDFIL